MGKFAEMERKHVSGTPVAGGDGPVEGGAESLWHQIPFVGLENCHRSRFQELPGEFGFCLNSCIMKDC